MFKLRQYQTRGIDLIRERIQKGDNKIIFWCMTGGGKGLIMSEINRLNLLRGNKISNVMRRRTIVFQTKENFKKYHDINSSIIMGKSSHFNKEKNVQIGSIDTLQRRYKNGSVDFLLDFNIILIDECHDTTSNQYRDFLNWLNENGVPKIFIGFTATPFKVGKRVHDWWDSCVKPIEAHELRDKGYLVHDKLYGPKKIDLSGLKKVQGDFHQGQLFDVMSEMSVIGDVVEGYKKYGQNKPAILFAVNINHSIMLAEAFRRAGIPARHYDQSHTHEERSKGKEDLKTGKIKIITNVNIFSTGFDAPFVEVGILARPTMSEILDIQQRGRILRPYKICAKCKNEYGGEDKCYKCNSTQLKYEKKCAIFIDHANNVDRHGLTYDVREAHLNSKKKSKSKIDSEKEISIKQCPECALYLPINARLCDSCGYEFKTKERQIKNEDGELVLIDEKTYKEKMKNKINIRWSNYQNQLRYTKHLSKDYPYIKIYDDFGIKVFDYIKFPPHLEKILRRKTILENHSKVYK